VSVNQHDVHFSTASNEWGTPRALFDQLDEEFGPFELNAAASAENTKCERHFSIQDNALIKEWEGRVWCNPPYGKEIGRFVAKARGEVRHGRASLVVLLIPARTDTNWWHDHIIADADIVRFLRGRVAFEGVSKVGHNAPFPSAIVVFRKSPDAE
jgi:phage N-6-adenine-methyltransferase